MNELLLAGGIALAIGLPLVFILIYFSFLLEDWLDERRRNKRRKDDDS